MSDPKHIVNLCPIWYDTVVKEYGMPDEAPYHALLNYALKIGALHEDREGPQISGTKHQPINYAEVMKSTAIMYGVRPEEMVQCWGAIDIIIMAANLKPLPATQKVRQDGSKII